MPHPNFGEGVVAVIAPKPGAQLDERSIQGALTNELAKYKKPKRVIVTSDIPRNAMGKVQKNLLRDQYKALLRQSGIWIRLGPAHALKGTRENRLTQRADRLSRRRRAQRHKWREKVRSTRAMTEENSLVRVWFTRID